ncbi:MAG: hypothetical protein H6622_14375 [Halobacteriovoraceae bacterium]|nr:hypothetical protein [Halobacteriovoraceae bacterium]
MKLFGIFFVFSHFCLPLYASSFEKRVIYNLDREYTLNYPENFHHSLGSKSSSSLENKVDFLQFHVDQNEYTIKDDSIVQYLLEAMKDHRSPKSHILREEIKLCDEVMAVLISWVAESDLGGPTIATHFELTDKVLNGKISLSVSLVYKIYLIDFLWRQYLEWKRQIRPGLGVVIPEKILETDKTYVAKQFELSQLTLGILREAITGLWEMVEKSSRPMGILSKINKGDISEIVEYAKYNNGMKVISKFKNDLHPTSRKIIHDTVKKEMQTDILNFFKFSWKENQRKYIILNTTRFYHSALVVAWISEFVRIATGEFDSSLFTVLSVSSIGEISKVRQDYVMNLKNTLYKRYNRYVLKEKFLLRTCSQLLE